MNWARSLYGKLSLTLGALFAGVGLLYMVLSTGLSGEQQSAGSQKLNRDLAESLKRELQLVVDGRLDPAAVEQAFHVFMMINPSIEVYLLDTGGRILSYSADPAKVRRERVDLAPIRAFLAGEDIFPLLGDDPRDSDRRKVFSVAPVPSAENHQGYLYVVLQGEDFDAVQAMEQARYLQRLGLWLLGASLLVGLLVGLVAFRWLTRRLRRLNDQVRRFQAADFAAAGLPRPGAGRDEIAALDRSFAAMAGRIVEQLEQLQDQDRLRRELVANVSHDLRTPLAALHGYLETLHLKQSRLSEQQREEFLEIALRHSGRLGRLIEDLFELSKLDAHEFKPVCEPFSMAELVQDVVQKFSLRAQQAQVALSFEGADRHPRVLGDIALIERALDNLVDNALAHTPAGGRVRLLLDAEGEQLRVTVEDTGRGIPQEQLPAIFQRFYQVDNAHRAGPHAGLGLAITKRILELHGQAIAASSQVDHGTRFEFHMPLAPG